MNAVGKIGEFIIKYQYPIEIALLSILAVIVLFALIKAIVRSRRDKNVLSQINSTVSDINNTVSSINDKQAAKVAKETEKATNNISISKDIPSVKVSYVVSDDDRDHQTTVSIDHEFVKDDEGKKQATSSEKINGLEEVKAVALVRDDLQSKDADDSIEALVKQIDSEKVTGEIAEHKICIDIPKVYVSRDCAIDKFGNVYTEEELSEQIK